jgi:mRNA interferase MazF
MTSIMKTYGKIAASNNYVPQENEIVVVRFPAGIGHEQGKERPAVIIQNQLGNIHSPTTIVVPLTTVFKKLDMPTHVVIYRADYPTLMSDSMILAEQIMTIDRSRIVYYNLGVLNERDRWRLNDAIKVSLNIH